MKEAYHVYQQVLAGICLAAPVVALAAFGALRLWRSARSAGFRRALFAALFAAPAIYLGATKTGTVKVDDPYIEDAGSYLTNDVAHIAIAKKTALLPDDTEILVYARSLASSNSVDWTRLLPYMAFSAHPYDYALPNATNYNVMVVADYTPPPTVHTNGVWVCYAGELWSTADATAYGLPASKIAMREARDYPYKYQVEYLESSGTQWIDTGIIPDDSYGFYVDFMGIGYDNNCRIIGVYETISGATCRWAGVVRTSSLDWYAGWKDAYNYTISESNRYRRRTMAVNFMDDRAIVFDGSTYASNLQANKTFSRTAIIFGNRNTDNSIIGLIAQRIYSAQISKDASLARDYIAVVDWEDVPCLYDRVSKSFFYNQGSGSFTPGPRVN